MKIHGIGCPKEWQEAWNTYFALTPQGKRMLDRVIELIYQELKKEASNHEDLINIYFTDSKSILKKALYGKFQDDKDLQSQEVGLVERTAYFRRWQDLRPYQETQAEIRWARK